MLAFPLENPGPEPLEGKDVQGSAAKLRVDSSTECTDYTQTDPIQ